MSYAPSESEGEKFDDINIDFLMEDEKKQQLSGKNVLKILLSDQVV